MKPSAPPSLKLDIQLPSVANPRFNQTLRKGAEYRAESVQYSCEVFLVIDFHGYCSLVIVT